MIECLLDVFQRDQQTFDATTIPSGSNRQYQGAGTLHQKPATVAPSRESTSIGIPRQVKGRSNGRHDASKQALNTARLNLSRFRILRLIDCLEVTKDSLPMSLNREDGAPSIASPRGVLKRPILSKSLQVNLKNLTTTFLRVRKPVPQSGLRVVQQVSNVLHPRVHHNGLSFQSKRITLLISLDTVQLGQSLIHDTCPSSGFSPNPHRIFDDGKTVSITNHM